MSRRVANGKWRVASGEYKLTDWQTRYSLLALTWLTAVFRIPSLFNNSFTTDEALFASFARTIAVWRDPLLINQPVDKPPLLFYLQALFYPMMGAEEWAARLPNFIAFMLLTPLIGMLVWRLYKNTHTAIIAALLVTLSPLLIQFSSTAYTDPLLVTLLIASMTVMLPKRHPIAAGLLFGLAMTTKYQAVLFLPLLAGIGWLYRWQWREMGRWGAGVMGSGGALFLWNLTRGQNSLWTTQIDNYGGLRHVWSWELWPRLQAWGALWVESMGKTAVSLPITAVSLLLIFYLLYKKRDQRDGLLALYISGYFLFHWLLAIPIWDRYLLLVLPLVLILLARGIAIASSEWRVAGKRRSISPAPLLISLSLILLLFLWPAQAARHGNPEADNGAGKIATALADAPDGTVLYDHWYSWQWRYHLFETAVYTAWFPNPAALADELAVFGNDGNPHYLVLPNDETALPVLRAVREAGFGLKQVTITNEKNSRIILYHIEE